jgi:hypothetical protein
MGTVVIHVLVIVLNVVEVHAALGEKVIWALGTEFVRGNPVSTSTILELVKVMTPPVLGTPVTLKFALNHT